MSDWVTSLVFYDEGETNAAGRYGDPAGHVLRFVQGIGPEEYDTDGSVFPMPFGTGFETVVGMKAVAHLTRDADVGWDHQYSPGTTVYDGVMVSLGSGAGAGVVANEQPDQGTDLSDEVIIFAVWGIPVQASLGEFVPESCGSLGAPCTDGSECCGGICTNGFCSLPIDL